MSGNTSGNPYRSRTVMKFYEFVCAAGESYRGDRLQRRADVPHEVEGFGRGGFGPCQTSKSWICHFFQSMGFFGFVPCQTSQSPGFVFSFDQRFWILVLLTYL